MLGRLVPVLAAVTLLTAGCVSLDGLTDFDAGDVQGTLFARETPLWHAPQDAPHPAFNYPTLTNPPEGEDVPVWWQPIRPGALPASIQGMEHVGGTGEDVATGAGIALFGGLAIVPGGQGTAILDISNPESPRVLSRMDEATRGAAVIPYPDGRLVTVLSTVSNVLVYDITDPTNPLELPSLEPETGSHKVAVVPGTPIVYNANSAGGGNAVQSQDPATATGVTEIYDLTDPEAPELVQVFGNGYGCHHIFFHINADEEYYRALCAGIEMTQLWDIADPRNPEVVVNVPVHHGNDDLPHTSVSFLRFSHFAVLSNDGSTLIVGDETGGGGLPGCDVGVNTPAGAASGPLGNLYFYDITDEQNPELKGFLSPTAPALHPESGTNNCTAHHGRLVPDPEGRDLLAMAFYGAGVVLVDFTDPAAPLIVDQWNEGTNTWEVWYYDGYLFTGDIARGLDALRFV